MHVLSVKTVYRRVRKRNIDLLPSTLDAAYPPPPPLPTSSPTECSRARTYPPCSFAKYLPSCLYLCICGCIFGTLARGYSSRIGRFIGRQRKTSSYGSITDSETQSWPCRLQLISFWSWMIRLLYSPSSKALRNFDRASLPSVDFWRTNSLRGKILYGLKKRAGGS